MPENGTLALPVQLAQYVNGRDLSVSYACARCRWLHTASNTSGDFNLTVTVASVPLALTFTGVAYQSVGLFGDDNVTVTVRAVTHPVGTNLHPISLSRVLISRWMQF
jgi:hypothetical protein